jgi:hypothetical protein
MNDTFQTQSATAPSRLHICHAPGMSSVLEPDADRLALFNLFPAFGNVEKTVRLATRKLDEIPDLGRADFLKIEYPRRGTHGHPARQARACRRGRYSN